MTVAGREGESGDRYKTSTKRVLSPDQVKVPVDSHSDSCPEIPKQKAASMFLQAVHWEMSAT